MSSQRRRCSTECKVEDAHRLIDSGRSVAEVARDLGVNELSLGNWVRDEHRRIEAAKETNLEPPSAAECVEFFGYSNRSANWTKT